MEQLKQQPSNWLPAALILVILACSLVEVAAHLPLDCARDGDGAVVCRRG